MDNKGRELERKTALGDVEAAAQLVSHGARTQNGGQVLQGVMGALPSLSIDDLRKINRVVCESLAEKQNTERTSNPDVYQDVKAGEIHMPDVGKVTPAELIGILEEFVDDALNGRSGSNPYVKETVRTSYDWRSGRSVTSKSENVKKAQAAFRDCNGEFLISCSSPIRVYAIQKKPDPEELARRQREIKKQHLKEELEKKTKLIEKAKKEALKAEQKLKKIKAQLAEIEPEKE